MIRRQQTVALNWFLLEKIMNEYNELLFSLKKEMRIFNFLRRCTWVLLEWD